MVNRMEYFHQRGCLVSGHGLDYVMYAPAPEEEIEAIFQKALKGESLAWEETAKYKTAFLLFLGRQYHRFGWVMQPHYGCKRDNNPAMSEKLDPEGFVL